MKMRLFDELVIETASGCNRACPTCLRQTGPARPEARMPDGMVLGLIDQAAALGFRSWVCLQWFNEPALDGRVGGFARHAKGRFREVFANTNGDLLEERAADLDGAFDRLHVALYGPGKAEREARLRRAFARTRLTFTDGRHVVTHRWPGKETLARAVRDAQGQPCERDCRMRMIVASDGAMRLCCEDVAGEYGLGSAGDTPLEDLWFGDRHREVLETLSKPGGRLAFPWCAECPRPNEPYWRSA